VAALGDKREALGDLGGPSRDSLAVTADVRAHEHVVPDRHGREQAAFLRHMRDAEIEHGPGWPAGDALPAEQDLTGPRREQAADDPQDRRLTGAVRPYQAGDLAGGHVEVETAQDVALAISGDDSA
jgi:hypothetical protein